MSHPHEMGRGRGMRPQGPHNLRRPNSNAEEALAQQMAGLNPYAHPGNNGGFPPGPRADGWSVGVNQFDNGYYPGASQFVPGAHAAPAPGHYVPQPNTSRTSAQDRLTAARSGAPQLNVGATEFVPKSNLSASANEFVPRQCASNTSDWANNQMRTTSIFYAQPLEQLDDAISTLSFSPGKFDSIAEHCVQVINHSILDLETLQTAVYRIFDACLSENNFRYTGARLLDQIAGYCTLDFQGHTFRSILLKRCQEMKTACETQLISSDPAQFHSFTLFLADLFLQLGIYTPEGNKFRIAVLGDAVVDLLLVLATRKPVNKDNLKTISSTLKMAGSSLEEEEKFNHSGASPKMDRLMLEVEQLSKLSDVPDVPKYMLDMMGQLVDLRKSSWGVNQPSPSVNQGPMSNLRNPYVMAEAAQIPQEFDPTDFLPDEEIAFEDDPSNMTAEEEAFLAEQMGENPDKGDKTATGDDNGEVLPEFEKDFEEFINNQSDK